MFDNFVCVRFYANTDFVANVVRAEHLEEHVRFNKIFRPGCAFYVNGELKQSAGFNADTLNAIRAKLDSLNINPNRASELPYR